MYDIIGYSLAVSGDTYLAVGAPGYSRHIVSGGGVFLYDANTGSELQLFIPDNSTCGDSCDLNFGVSVAVVVAGITDENMDEVSTACDLTVSC